MVDYNRTAPREDISSNYLPLPHPEKRVINRLPGSVKSFNSLTDKSVLTAVTRQKL